MQNADGVPIGLIAHWEQLGQTNESDVNPPEGNTNPSEGNNP